MLQATDHRTRGSGSPVSRRATVAICIAVLLVALPAAAVELATGDLLAISGGTLYRVEPAPLTALGSGFTGVRSMRVRDDRIVFVLTDTALQTWDPATGITDTVASHSGVWDSFTLGRAGEVYVAVDDGGTKGVRVVDSTTGSVSDILLDPTLNPPFGIAFDARDATLFLASLFGGDLVDPRSGTRTAQGAASGAYTELAMARDPLSGDSTLFGASFDRAAGSYWHDAFGQYFSWIHDLHTCTPPAPPALQPSNAIDYSLVAQGGMLGYMGCSSTASPGSIFTVGYAWDPPSGFSIGSTAIDTFTGVEGLAIVHEPPSIAPGEILVTRQVTGGIVSGGAAIMKTDGVLISGGVNSRFTGIALDLDHHPIVVDPIDDVVLRIDPASGVQTVVSSGGLLATPYDVAVEADGDILVTDLVALLRIDPTTGAQTILTPLVAGANGLTVGASGDIYVVHGVSQEVLRVDPDSGAVTTVSSGGFLDSPADVVEEASGDLLVSDPYFGLLVRINPTTGSQLPLTMDSQLENAKTIDLDANGDLILAGGSEVLRFDPDFGGITVLDTVHEGFGVAVVFPVCDDGLDNDGDGLIDSPADPGCANATDADEQDAGLVCDNGIDDDGDTDIDFPADSGCTSSTDPTETSACDNGSDDDGDGLIDFGSDPGCADADDDTETDSGLVCDDGTDNDGDGFIDTPDPGCSGPTDPTETDASLVCDDGNDNDGDGLVDVAGDAGCSAPTDPTETDPALICDNGLDDDGDTFTDFPADPHCSSQTDPTEAAACSDGADNDGDGATDFPADAGCADATDDAETDPSRICDDGIDNDFDGDIDVANDPGCTSGADTSERDPGLVCDDGVDNDGDGQTDFPTDPGCLSNLDADEIDPSLACDDGVDNDGDGAIDFRPGPFAGDPGCMAPWEFDETDFSLPCDDGIDNDSDGRIDFDPVTFADAPDFTAGTGDTGCNGPAWITEMPECSDGTNNDPIADPAPGLIDWDGGQWLYGACSGGSCPPGVSDPDGDGVADPDPQCVNTPWKNKERTGCGLGFELALLLPLLRAARRRRGASAEPDPAEAEGLPVTV